MEAYIRVNNQTHIVEFMHRMPFDPVVGMGKTKEELLETGVFVDSIPNPENKIGMRAVPYYNADTKKVYYEYKSIPLTDQERIEQLEETVNYLLLKE